MVTTQTRQRKPQSSCLPWFVLTWLRGRNLENGWTAASKVQILTIRHCNSSIYYCGGRSCFQISTQTARIGELHDEPTQHRLGLTTCSLIDKNENREKVNKSWRSITGRTHHEQTVLGQRMQIRCRLAEYNAKPRFKVQRAAQAEVSQNMKVSLGDMNSQPSKKS